MSGSWAGLTSATTVGKPNGKGKYDRKEKPAGEKQWPEVPNADEPTIVKRMSRNGRFEISNVPRPKRTELTGPRFYPWNELSVGESFFIPEKTRYRIRNDIHGKRFISRAVTENEKVGVRVWRVE